MIEKLKSHFETSENKKSAKFNNQGEILSALLVNLKTPLLPHIQMMNRQMKYYQRQKVVDQFKSSEPWAAMDFFRTEFLLGIVHPRSSEVHKKFQNSKFETAAQILELVEYLNIITCSQQVETRIGKILVSSILERGLPVEERAALLKETLKLAFSKPGYQRLLQGLNL